MRISLPILSFLVIASLSLIPYTSNAQSNVVGDDVEFQVLKNIYDSLGGAGWTNKANWPTPGNWPATATSTQFKTWQGVTVTNGDITAFTFNNNNNIQGIIPRSIGKLKALQGFTINSNALLTSDIPASIGSLPNLVTLSLLRNKLSGLLPSSLASLTNLTTLNVSANALTGAIPNLGALTKLTSLDLSSNSFTTGPIPSWISTITTLTNLNLGSTLRTGPLPDGMGNLVNLTTLGLTGNQLTGPIPSWIGNLTKLTTLQLGNNQLTGSIPDNIGNLTSLTSLTLNNNQLTSIPSTIGNLTNVVTLYIFNNNLTGMVPPEMGNMTKLSNLQLQVNQLTGTIPPSLGNLSNLTTLNLSSNQLTGGIPTSLGGLSKLTTLTLSSNKLTGSIPTELGALTKLTSLTLNTNQFSGPIPSSIGNLTLLNGLYLYSNQLTGTIPDSFGNLVNLYYLYIASNQLSGTLPSSLGNMTKLGYFNINSNQITGAIPSTFSNLTQVISFYANSNKLTGAFPSVFGNWTKLMTFQIQDNSFTGDFPSSIGSCTALSSFSGGNNHFTSLPATLSNLPVLINVSFFNNDLVSIPTFAAATKANLTLAVQNNKLDFVNLEQTSGIKAVTLSPQKPIGNVAYITPVINTSLTIAAPANGTSGGTVTWERLVNNVWTNVNAQNQDNTQATYKRTPFALSDEGVYHWKMTNNNSKLSGVILQSNAVTVKVPVHLAMDNWTFQYQYDGRRRMTGKKVPGADWVYMVYDSRDRLVLTQDGNQRIANQWEFIKYDVLNRPVMTGIYTHTSFVDQPTMQGVVDAFYTLPLPTSKAWYDAYLGTGSMHGYDNKSFPQLSNANLCNTVTYYDNYAFQSLFGTGYDYTPQDVASQTVNGVPYSQSATAFAYVTGQVTGTKVQTQPTGTWLNSVTYYDNKYRAVQSVSDNIRAGKDRVTNLVDFTGKVLGSKTTHNSSGKPAIAVARRFEYDHASRLINTWHQTGANAEVLLAKNNYNELGQLVDKQLYSTDGGSTFKQSTDYRYNIRGWLSSINNSQLVNDGTTNDDSNDLFGMELKYNDVVAGINNTPQYNGNISAMKWNGGKAYAYRYDTLNRIKSSAYFTTNGTSWTASKAFAERGFGYDLNGNIQKLIRSGTGGSVMDSLTYNYGSGKTKSTRLVSVNDAGDIADGFADGNVVGADTRMIPRAA